MNPDDKRLKRLFTSVVGGSWGEEPGNAEVDMLCIRGTDFDAARFRVNTSRAPTRAFTGREIDIRAAVSGDLIIEKSGGSDQQPVGRAVLWDGVNHVMPTNFTARLRVAAGVDPRYATYLLASMWSDGRTRAAINQTTGIQNLDLGTFLDQRISCPPPQTQGAIADHLDRETAQIDALIATNRRMVELLNERSVAIIENAILQSKWPKMPFRRLLRRIEQGWSPQCDSRLPEGNEWGVLKVGCVNHGAFRADEVKVLPSEIIPHSKYIVQNGDLLLSRANTRDLVGSAAVVSDVRPRTLLCDKLFRLVLDENKADPRFVSLYLQTRVARDQIELDATGASNTMQNVGQDTVRSLAIPLPDLKVQHALTNDCMRQREWVATSINVISRQVTLLAERRQALITAAVTGQLDIPEAA